ncbi:MAG: hypothetical protein SWC96_15015 [Thermodesulfobacteriota bacterium]|nr:hypothetical protein [Thermodesulfobacteriota bacterium]
MTTCKTGAIRLGKKSFQTVPPRTTEDLMEAIMAGKKGTAGRLPAAAKGVVGIKRVNGACLGDRAENK